MAEAFQSDAGKHEIPDEDYDVISVIYHCLQGCETAKKYERDARDADDNDLADYFQQVQKMNLELASRGREFLKQWINRESVSEGSSKEGKSNVEMMPKRDQKKSGSSPEGKGADSPVANIGDAVSGDKGEKKGSGEDVKDIDSDSGDDRSQAV